MKGSFLMRCCYATFFVFLLLGGCSPVHHYHGWFGDEGQLKSLHSKHATMKAVQEALGPPTFVSTVNPEVWYYIRHVTCSGASFLRPDTLEYAAWCLNFSKSGTLIKVTPLTKTNLNLEVNARETSVEDYSPAWYKRVFRNLGRVGGGREKL
jgi:outer membrane protein assembly factor BamE (lipoprotein component of BamABCDE complex)